MNLLDETKKIMKNALKEQATKANANVLETSIDINLQGNEYIICYALNIKNEFSKKLKSSDVLGFYALMGGRTIHKHMSDSIIKLSQNNGIIIGDTVVRVYTKDELGATPLCALMNKDQFIKEIELSEIIKPT